MKELANKLTFLYMQNFLKKTEMSVEEFMQQFQTIESQIYNILREEQTEFQRKCIKLNDQMLNK